MCLTPSSAVEYRLPRERLRTHSTVSNEREGPLCIHVDRQVLLRRVCFRSLNSYKNRIPTCGYVGRLVRRRALSPHSKSPCRKCQINLDDPSQKSHTLPDGRGRWSGVSIQSVPADPWPYSPPAIAAGPAPSDRCRWPADPLIGRGSARTTCRCERTSGGRRPVVDQAEKDYHTGAVCDPPGEAFPMGVDWRPSICARRSAFPPSIRGDHRRARTIGTEMKRREHFSRLKQTVHGRLFLNAGATGRRMQCY